jgi:hypothetical protein
VRDVAAASAGYAYFGERLRAPFKDDDAKAGMGLRRGDGAEKPCGAAADHEKVDAFHGVGAESD